MKDEKKEMKCNCGKWNGAHTGAANTVYCFGLVGALVYFLQHADGFSAVLMGILKAVLWPGFLIYRLLEFLSM